MEKKKTGISQTGARMPVVLLKSLLVSYGRGAVITSGTVAVSDAAFRTGSVDRNSCNLCGDSGTFRLACRKRNAGSALFMGTFDRESVFLCAGSFDFDSQSWPSGCR